MRLSASGVALLPLYFSLTWTTAASEVAYLVKESVVPPVGWIKVGRAPISHKLKLRIGLPQPNFSILEQNLFEVSDPYHERYGAHLSKEEVDAIVAPSEASINSVDKWLGSFGLSESNYTRSDAKDWVYVTIPVTLAEAMLNTTYHLWKHVESGDHTVRTTIYKLPDYVHKHVDVIQPTTSFARLKAMKSTLHWPGRNDNQVFEAKKASSHHKANVGDTLASPEIPEPTCSEVVSVKCLAQLYKSEGYVPRATKKNGLGITGYLEQFLNHEDLRLFFESQLPEAVNLTYKYYPVNGGQNNQTLDQAGVEAGLDAQYGFGLAFPTPGTFWSTGGRPPFIPDAFTQINDNEPYADWLDFVLKQKDIPQSISTSYAEHEQTVPEAYARRVCNGFAQLGARGVSLLFASGDYGVGDGNGDPETQVCFTNDGKNTTKFLPSFPASCPYVTAVGGTYGIPEIGVPFSGGGFSDYFPQPSYQKSAVQGYFSQLAANQYEGLYNPKGRAFPDVSAQSWLFRTWWKGSPNILGGTSASSPTVAALVALLNDARLAKKQSPLGFLNPLLYSKGVEGFNDITEGNNPGCGTPGFSALPGWDPVTGLGTPDFSALRKLLDC